LQDLYPFVLGPLAIEKLAFVAQRIKEIAPQRQDDANRRRREKRGVFRRLRTGQA
jgi:hypothetical protein